MLGLGRLEMQQKHLARGSWLKGGVCMSVLWPTTSTDDECSHQHRLPVYLVQPVMYDINRKTYRL